jgi:FxsC-like protein
VTAQFPPGGIYFYLSHAQRPRPSINHWVKTFFDDLCSEVDRLATVGDNMGAGFVDMLPAGEERDNSVTAALHAAHVFVPMYEPVYLDRPSHERWVFEQRMDPTPSAVRSGHVQPVLWTPVARHANTADLDRALELGRGFAVYRQRGLEEMCRLREHWPQYRLIVGKLAIRIVDAAETSALTPTHLTTPPPVPLDYQLPVIDPLATDSGTPFVVAVIAPTATWIPSERLGTGYGARSIMWRPFERVATAAGFTATVVRGMRLPVRIVDVSVGGSPFDQAPGVILLDPWTIAFDHGRRAVLTALNALPEWVTVVLIVNRDDPQAPRGAVLATEVAQAFPRTAYVVTVRDAYEFEQLMPDVVDRTWRRYARTRPTFPPDGLPQRRPRLNEPDMWSDQEPEEDR